jgi:hypothetical protein
LAARCIGVLGVLISLIALPTWGEFPTRNTPLLVFCSDWIFIIAIPFAAYTYGAIIGYHAMLAALGYQYFEDDSFSENQSFSTNDSSIHRASDYSTSTSINPSSGLPMSGSSGMDVSGNPYGTRSW